MLVDETIPLEGADIHTFQLSPFPSAWEESLLTLPVVSSGLIKGIISLCGFFPPITGLDFSGGPSYPFNIHSFPGRIWDVLEDVLKRWT